MLEEHEHESNFDYTSINSSANPIDYGPGMSGALSPQAVTTIYNLYIQGWTIREISKRFGILPSRAKFCVWARAQLYH